jgi:SAM-dependent methyltransferase
MALDYPKREITLAHCPSCGFIFNSTFDPSLHEYSGRYEETQGFSATFRAFHQRLAETLIDQYDLRRKKIIEIGCGKGEFLSLLCELGNTYGVGFDPSYVDDRNHSPARHRMEFIADFYSEKYTTYDADFVCCKMTLEHIQPVQEFVSIVRRSIADRIHTKVFFQVPNAAKVLRDLAFWDIYYEHCSYFTEKSLRLLFERSGFDILETGFEYDDQYLTITAIPARGHSSSPHAGGENLSAEVRRFAQQCATRLTAWRRLLAQFRAHGRRVVLWGGGSKAVAFLTAVDTGDSVTYAVDINPFRTGTFLAGSGQEIVRPEFLLRYRPDVVIVMNPVYRNEIGAQLAEMNLSPRVLTVEDDAPDITS